MKKILLLISSLAFAIGVSAKPEKGEKKGNPSEGRPSREEIIKKFDKDGDGKLSDEERSSQKWRTAVVVVNYPFL